MPVSWSGDDLVVICGGNHFRGEKKMHDVHLAEHLASHARVLYVDPPVSHLTPRRRPELAAMLEHPRLRLIGDSLAQLTPVVAPKPLSAPVVRSTEVLVRRAIVHAVRRLGATPAAIISAWPFLDVFDACPDARKVYWWTDDPASAADLWRMNCARLVAGDRRIAARSDLVIAVSERAVERFRAEGLDARFFPNGCDAETMALTDVVPVAPDVRLPAPVAGFVGHLNARTDLSLLEGVAASGMSLLMVGPCVPGFEPERMAALCACPHVAWVGSRPFDQIPAYLGHVDVGLVPYADTEFNRSSFPLKALEYLAAGRPVVSTGLPGIRWLATDQIVVADTPSAFAEAVARSVAGARDPIAMERRRAFAGGHSWTERAWALASLLGLGGDAAARSPRPTLIAPHPNPAAYAERSRS